LSVGFLWTKASAAAGAVVVAAAECEAAEVVGEDSVAVRRVEDFPVADGLLPDRAAEAAGVLREAGAVELEAAASTAAHRSVLPAADARAVG
jgi:hypothetical protein